LQYPQWWWSFLVKFFAPAPACRQAKSGLACPRYLVIQRKKNHAKDWDKPSSCQRHGPQYLPSGWARIQIFHQSPFAEGDNNWCRAMDARPGTNSAAHPWHCPLRATFLFPQNLSHRRSAPRQTIRCSAPTRSPSRAALAWHRWAWPRTSPMRRAGRWQKSILQSSSCPTPRHHRRKCGVPSCRSGLRR
jgi:hypothetical protein